MRFVGSRSCAFYAAISLAFVGPLNAPSAAKERSPEPAATSAAAGAAAATIKSLAAKPTVEGSASAEQLVQRALAAEAAGDSALRADLLQQALVANPDCAPAHWQQGEVRFGDSWQRPDAPAGENKLAATFAAYRQQRAKMRATAEDHVKLARWCEEEGLEQQAKMHLRAALGQRPSKGQRNDIVRKLGLVRYQNQLVPSATATALKERAKNVEAATQKWKPVLNRLRGDLESRDVARQAEAREQLLAIDDPLAIAALESVFAKAKPDAGKAAVAAIAGIKGRDATDSLVRHAILAERDEVRQAAATALKSRDPFSFVPFLVSSMKSPIEVKFQTYGDGSVFYERLSLFREGPLFNVSMISSTLSAEASPNEMLVNAISPTDVAQAARARLTTIGNANRNITNGAAEVAAQAAADAKLAAAAHQENVQTDLLNHRIGEALHVVTDNDLGDSPRAWWDWWNEFTDTHYGYDKPTYQDVRAVQTNSSTQPRHSCFVPGTKVWTITGTMPIETVQVGDWVLTKDVETGELGYKPVTATTVGPPLPLVETRVGNETIRSTYGHLFWVSGLGWRMAKELEAGQLLHTTRGALPIESVEKTGEAVCHNLIVPDTNTYFVSDEKILVHDIDMRGPTTATVPGLVDP